MSKYPNRRLKIIGYIASFSFVVFLIYKYGFLIIFYFFTPSKKTYPFSEKESFFLDSIRINNKKYTRVERDKIYYSNTWLYDFKSDFEIDIEIRRNKKEINYQKLKNDAKIIANRAYKNFNYDDSKTNNFIVKYNIIKDLPIIDSIVMKNNKNKFYYPNQIDTIINYQYSKKELKTQI